MSDCSDLTNTWATNDPAIVYRQTTRYNHRLSRIRAAYKAMLRDEVETMYRWADFHCGLQIELVCMLYCAARLPR